MKEKKQMKAPHVFVLVLIMIVCATLLTYVLPAGSYNRYVDESTGTTLVEKSIRPSSVTPLLRQASAAPIWCWRPTNPFVPKLRLPTVSSLRLM